MVRRVCEQADRRKMSQRSREFSSGAVESLNGGVANNNQHGLLTIKHRNAEDNDDRIQIKMGLSVAPRNFTETRTLQFSADRIDIRDSWGTTLNLRDKQDNATIPLSSFADRGNGDKLAFIRERNTGRRALTSVASRTPLILPGSTQRVGLPIPTKRPTPSQVNPPREMMPYGY